MKINSSTFIFLIAGTLILNFSGKVLAQQYTEESRVVTDFSAIEVGGIAVVNLQQGVEESIDIRASGIPISDIRTEIVGSVLHIYTVGRHNGEDIEINITFDDLNLISVDGAAEVYFTGEVESENFQIFTQGAGEIEGLSIDADTVFVSINDAGNADIQVDTDLLRIQMRDAGDLRVSGVTNQREIEELSSNGTLYDQNLVVSNN